LAGFRGPCAEGQKLFIDRNSGNTEISNPHCAGPFVGATSFGLSDNSCGSGQRFSSILNMCVGGFSRDSNVG